MRSLVLILLFAIGLDMTVLHGQSIVVTIPQYRNIVLEDYTGIHCGYCPDGHEIAGTLSNDNPDRFVIINIHAGVFAEPGFGEPDFRTIFGENLVNIMGVSAYPSGTINRHVFSDFSIVPSLDRFVWNEAASKILPQRSNVNIGYVSTFDTLSKELIVNVELYYVNSSPLPVNFLHIALLENHVYGFQSDYSNGSHQNYDHKNILRHFLTGQWGADILTTTQGSLVTQSFSYIVPQEYNIDSCDLAVFVVQNIFDTYTGVKGIANGGFHNGETATYIGDLLMYGDNIAEGVEGSGVSFTTTMISSLPGDEVFEVTLSSDNAPVDWQSSYFYDGIEYFSTETFTLSNYSANNFEINAIAGNSPCFAKYTLEIVSVNYPLAPSRSIDVYVVNGITDLIVNGTGTWGEGDGYNFDQNIIEGLDYAGNTSYALIDGNIFTRSVDVSALTDVNNVYLNIGWRFPSFTDEQAVSIMSFMDNGGNIFVCGQDIGWDIVNSNGNGTAITAQLYSDYFHAQYINDGGDFNNELTPVISDDVFGTMNSSGIIDIFNGYFFPDEIEPIGNAVAIFNYNGNSGKTAGIRFENTDYKVVYLCVDLAMISDNSIQKEIIKRSHDWFYEPESISNSLTEKTLGFYPNPAFDVLNIDVGSEIIRDNIIEIVDVSGKVVMDFDLKMQSTFSGQIDISNLQSGLYFIRITTTEGPVIKRFEKI